MTTTNCDIRKRQTSSNKSSIRQESPSNVTLTEKSENPSTSKMKRPRTVGTSYGWRQFIKFCKIKKYKLKKDTPIEEIAAILKDWTENIRKPDGDEYKQYTVKSIWDITAKLIQDKYAKEHNRFFNPFKDEEFKSARDAKNSKMQRLKHKQSSLVLTFKEIEALIDTCDEDTPEGLQKKFFYIITTELQWRSKEAESCLLQHFQENKFTEGIQYNPLFTKIKEDIKYENTRVLKPNLENPEKCPVLLYRKLLEKRTKNITTERFFITPNQLWKCSDSWFIDCPLTSNKFAQWIKRPVIESKKIPKNNTVFIPEDEDPQTKSIVTTQDKITRSRSSVWRQFLQFCASSNYQLEKNTSTTELAMILQDWAVNMRKNNGDEYKECSVKFVWYTTAKMLQEKYLNEYNRTFNPFYDEEFKVARDVKKCKINELHHNPNKRTKSTSVLSIDEYNSMINSCDENTPEGLQMKFYLVITLILGWCGTESVTSLIHHFQEELIDGNFSGRVLYNPSFTKDFKKDNYRNTKVFIQNIQDLDKCPVRLFQKLVEKRKENITTERLFVTANPYWKKNGSYWYKDWPAGKNAVARWFKKCAQKAGLETEGRKFTSNSSRSTIKIHMLDREFEPPRKKWKESGLNNLPSTSTLKIEASSEYEDDFFRREIKEVNL